MYTKSTEYFDLLFSFKDYKAASKLLIQMIKSQAPDSISLLDIACATGPHLIHLKDSFSVEGLDINPDLLKIAKHKSPEITFHQADMTNFKLGKEYDVITCLNASIAYSQTIPRLNSAIRLMAHHTKKDGLLFFEPWISPDSYWEEKIVHNFSESDNLKISWMYVGKRENKLVTNEIHYTVGTPDGVYSFQETHKMGLFSYQDYTDALASAGYKLISYNDNGFFGCGLYLAKKI